MAGTAQKLLTCQLTLIILFTCGSHALIVTDVLQTQENWKFLARFCFLSKNGKLSFEVVYPHEYAVQNLLLYFDSSNQWPQVYGPSAPLKTCSSKESVLVPENNQIISLSPQVEWAGCNLVQIVGASYYNCSGDRSFESVRERWWYIALDNCNSTKGLAINYTLHMTNGYPNETFFAELSADEFYILQVDIAFMVAYALILIITIAVAATLAGRQLLHSTYKLFTASVLMEFMALIFNIAYYGGYANTGLPEASVQSLGRACYAVSNLIFLLMLILMGKGYTITRGRISSASSIKIAVFMTMYAIVYIVLFIWDAVYSDPGFVLYIYDNWPGYGLIAMRIISHVWFVYAVFFTIKHHPDRRRFYYLFLAFFTVWFWAGPVVILIAMQAMYPWVREKVVNAVELCVMLCGHLVFLVLTRPGAANKNFPYHIRTTQIGIINEPENQNGMAMSNGAYTGNPYEVPTATAESTQNAQNFLYMFATTQNSNVNNQRMSESSLRTTNGHIVSK